MALPVAPRRPSLLVLAVALLAALLPVAPTAAQDQTPGLNEQVADGFEVVGHEPLFSRGMNAAIAKHGDYVYVGNRTDGQEEHPHPGILVVDVSDPSDPQVVGEIGPPDAGLVGETSRELRVWPQQDLLIVMNFACSSSIHDCANTRPAPRYTFFDIGGANAASPELVAELETPYTPHEMFLWVDPMRPDERALLYWTTVTSSRVIPSLVVTDLSRAREGVFSTAGEWTATFPAGTLPDGSREDRRLHSLGVSNDGREGYLAFLGAGYLTLDTSEVAAGVEDPEMRLLTPPENRVNWSNPGAHSAVRLYRRDIVLVTDEVYGDALGPSHGCPWGWMRTIDVSDDAHPEVIGEYRVEETTDAYCESPAGQDPANTLFTSYSAHNPTFTDDLAFITWHSAGLEVVDLRDPRNPQRAGKFKPAPLPSVATEDPALSSGLDKVVMWSYPIISDGLIYVIDIRNGLYILRYTKPGKAAALRGIDYLEGNSNLGYALRLEPVRRSNAPRPFRSGGAGRG